MLLSRVDSSRALRSCATTVEAVTVVPGLQYIGIKKQPRQDYFVRFPVDVTFVSLLGFDSVLLKTMTRLQACLYSTWYNSFAVHLVRFIVSPILAVGVAMPVGGRAGGPERGRDGGA